mgnify:CR=1 FL=1
MQNHNSEKYLKSYFHDKSIISSFELVEDKSILRNKRKYGQLIISKDTIKYLDERCIEVPFTKTVSKNDVLYYESLLKNKLGSRAYGLNEN